MRILARVGERLADGRYTVEIADVFGLDDLSEAHRRVVASGVHGKVVVEPGA